ncbi:MAG: putative metal-binding motif-containing protein [Myxococcales bacterium]|nr:putative metal-binding motif-containing protein [Myxococcales bacterium]
METEYASTKSETARTRTHARKATLVLGTLLCLTLAAACSSRRTTPGSNANAGADGGFPDPVDNPMGMVGNSADTDDDGDGFTENEGDCNDNDRNANPGALDTIGNMVDEDCNDIPDDTETNCDAMITDVADNDPLNGARAIGLCKMASGSSWGVISARYVRADGSEGMAAASHGLLTNFGPNVAPREGARVLALSSGTARRPSDAGFRSPSGGGFIGGADMGTTSATPTGFPVDFPACGVSTANDPTANDPAALEVELRVPTNAKSLKFLFDFYTAEFPTYVCQEFNDFFVALQTPPPENAQHGNISFDTMNNSVSVNHGFLEVCSPQEAGGKNFPCTLGTDELSSTGYEGRAATGWLETVSPVEPGSVITLRFAIWDAGDHSLDSLVLIDGFEFSAEEDEEATTIQVK